MKLRSLCFSVLMTSLATGVMADTTFKAGYVLLPDGSLATGRAVVVGDDGLIKRIISADEIPENATTIDLGDVVLSPGLIDIDSSLGIRGNNGEREVIDPSADVADAVDMAAPDLIRAVHAGVTTAMITPSRANVVPGRCATIRTWSADGSTDVLKRGSALSIVLASSAYNPSREPSSRAGALSMLREELRAARDGGSASLAPALKGEVPVLVTCETVQDVTTAIALFGQHGITPIIIHSRDVGEIAGDLAESNVPVVIGPYSFGSDNVTLEGGAAIDEARGVFVFSGQTGSGDPERLRISAILATRCGMRPESARMAMTSAAARVAGVADQVGSIAPGHAADFAVFSGDPLRLDSKVLEVWIKGQRVYSAASTEYDHEAVIGAIHD